jgi:hypothetical protein
MKPPTFERVNELLTVNTASGVITWRKGQGRAAAGAVAGRIGVNGYRSLCIDRQHFSAHALVWFVATGDWPERIDHINGLRADNRIANLRLASAADNARNRTNWRHRKLLGAHPLPNGRYQGLLTADGEVFSLGSYDTEEEAHQAYVAARAAVAAAEKQARQDALKHLVLLRKVA